MNFKYHSRLSCSKVKETLEFYEKKFHELKVSNEKNQQALDQARLQIKVKINMNYCF